MKKKLIILMIGITLLCGCTATSTLEIKEDTIKEEVVFEGTPKDEEAVKEYIEGGAFYSHKKTGSGYNRTFTGEFPMNKFKEESITTDCFSNFKIENDKAYGNYNIEMSNFSCDEELQQATKFILKIKADGDIISCNNFTEENGYLIWYFEENNIPNVNCKISYGEGTKEEIPPEPEPEPEPEPIKEPEPKPVKEEPIKKEITKEEIIQTVVIGGIVGGFVLVLVIAMIVGANIANKNR